MFQFSYFGVFSKNINLKHNTFKVTRVKFKAEDIPDKSLVGGKVPKCITSQLAQLKIIVYFIPIDKNIAEYKVYVNPARWYAGLKCILQLLL